MPTVQNDTTLCAVFNETVGRFPNQVALRDVDATSCYTYQQYRDAIADVASALYGCGVRRGDTVALMFENRPEFHIADAAAMHLGAATCSIYNTSPVRDIAYVISTSGAQIALCESVFAASLRSADADLRIICTEPGVPDTESLAALARPTDFDFDQYWRTVQPDDVLTLIYTSGTTGEPKPVELTHASMLSEILLVADELEFRPGDTVPSALPMAHAAQRWGSHYNALMFGLEVVCIADLAQLASSLVKIQPRIWGSVPRVLEKMVMAVRSRIEAEPNQQVRERLEDAIGAGQRYAAAHEAHRAGSQGPPAPDLVAERARVEPILAEIRQSMGLSNLRWLMVGAAPTAPHIHSYLAGLGLEIVEVWGMSELGAVATINPVGRQRSGTVGVPLRDVDVTLADDGEILVRGPILMRGYRGQPEATAEAFTSDGRLRTGDLGHIDSDGYLSVTGRKKEIIVNAAGKNISPAKVEALLKAESPLIGSAVAIGDARPYLTALIALDPDALIHLAHTHGLNVDDTGDLMRSDIAARVIADAVAAANEHLARVEQIKRYVVVPRFWVPGGEELTPTLKLKRRVINELYRDEIESMYTMAEAGR
ncbi:hypothetical protein BST14_18580 [Mycobacterium arosiense ATCC BAA-1401 = DSM 45069]|uniref:AMP-dependent synthetase/ligase domain-containing protein n=2 Tax=Mycobacterium arosiense TaxID=425468 RepID=A0A1W9ZBM9_MYCAI|nr:hypothetical protein BST14_18580 [Mycobacterium arosiense ATCC BAA-1401 = DSM 45069]